MTQVSDGGLAHDPEGITLDRSDSGPGPATRGRLTKVVLGIDIGTYSTKGVLVTKEGDVVASASEEHDLSLPHPGWAEHDPEQVWWREFQLICQRLLTDADVVAEQVAAVGISTISPAVVPVDSDGMPLRPAILYGIDTRAIDEVKMLNRLTGATLSAQSGAPKILWIRRKEPDVWARTHQVVNGSGYLTFKLTGEATIDVYDAAVFAPLFDTRQRMWDAELSKTIAPPKMLPRVTWTHEIAGTISPKAARATGLAPGTPVITGTADAAAEAISSGMSQIGDMMLMVGSSTMFILKTGHVVPTEQFWSSPFLEPGSAVVAGGTATAGSLTRWFRDQFAPQERMNEKVGDMNAYAALAELASQSPPGARDLVMLPYFAGERTPIHDPLAKGALLGLTLSHTRSDLYRALLESVGYAVRHNLDIMAQQGIHVQRLFAVGGGTRNRLWMQIISDIAGTELHIPRQQIGASYGDAFLAATGLGWFSSTAEAHRWITIQETVQPSKGDCETYDRAYAVYRQFYPATAPLMHKLGASASDR